MKINMKMSFVLGLLLLSSCTFLQSSNLTKLSVTPAAPSGPSLVLLDVTKNWSATLAGWLNPDGSPIQFNVATTTVSGPPPAAVQCRAAFKPLISSATFSDCSSGVYLPTPTAGATDYIYNDNGTYRFEVQVLDSSGDVIISDYREFYVHPSLSRVPECAPPHTANEYFATAASYLSTINNFGPSTLLEGPFNKVQFLINGEATRMNISLRKKYAINGDNTLLLVHRSRAKWTSATQAGILAGMPVDVMDGGVTRPAVTSDVVYRAPGSLSSSYQTVDSKCEVSVFTEGNGSYHFASRLVDDGSGTPVVDEIYERGLYNVTGTTHYLETQNRVNNPGEYNRLYGIDPVYYLTHDLDVNRGGKNRNGRVSTIALKNLVSTEIGLGSRTLGPNFSRTTYVSCDAIVMNAEGKGLCFHHGLLTDPLPLRRAHLTMYRESGYNASAAFDNPLAFGTGKILSTSSLKVSPEVIQATALIHGAGTATYVGSLIEDRVFVNH